MAPRPFPKIRESERAAWGCAATGRYAPGGLRVTAFSDLPRARAVPPERAGAWPSLAGPGGLAAAQAHGDPEAFQHTWDV